MMFLVDTNVLIEAKNRYYAFDIAPGFWHWLENAYSRGVVGSIERVREELLQGKDELSDWARDHGSFFFPLDGRTTQVFPKLSAWAQSQNFKPEALNAFAAGTADFMLVAHASAHFCTVVTHEKAGTGSHKRVKIPDACAALDVPCIDTFKMLRKERATLELAP